MWLKVLFFAWLACCYVKCVGWNLFVNHNLNLNFYTKKGINMKLKATKKYCQQTLLIKSKSMTFNLLGDIKKYEILSFFEKSNF